MGVGLCTEQREKVLRRGDFIRSSSEHKEARQKLDYWEMEVSCRVTVTVWGGGATPRWYHHSPPLFCLMRRRCRLPRATRGHADVICLSDTMTGKPRRCRKTARKWECEWVTVLVDSSGPTMKLVKATIIDGKGISIFSGILETWYAPWYILCWR